MKFLEKLNNSFFNDPTRAIPKIDDFPITRSAWREIPSDKSARHDRSDVATVSFIVTRKFSEVTMIPLKGKSLRSYSRCRNKSRYAKGSDDRNGGTTRFIVIPIFTPSSSIPRGSGTRISSQQIQCPIQLVSRRFRGTASVTLWKMSYCVHGFLCILDAFQLNLWSRGFHRVRRIDLWPPQSSCVRPGSSHVFVMNISEVDVL